MRISSIVLGSFLIATMGVSQAAALVPTPTPTPLHIQKLAAADEYFGAFGMSPLSIRSTIGFLGREYHWRTISDHDLLRKALMVQDALHIWRTKYPEDPWLAPTFYHLEQLYQAVQSDESRKHATAMLNEVVRYYPNTKEGHLSRSRAAAGFPPLVEETPLLNNPTPPAPASLPTNTTAPDPVETAPLPPASIAPAADDTNTPTPQQPQ
jgi:hypothetical protein